MESSLTCHHLYADLFSQYHRMVAEVHLIDSENTQLAKTLAREMLTQQQLLTTQKEQGTKPSSYPNRPTERYPKKTRRRGQRQGVNQGQQSEKDEEGEEDEEERQTQAYSCPYEDCGREYRSSIALNLHMKSKHNGGTKKEREAYSRQVMDAQRGLCAFPSERLNLPPGFVEQFRQNYDYQRKYKM